LGNQAHGRAVKRKHESVQLLSLPYDKGCENVEQEYTNNKVLAKKSYFYEPFDRWQKALGENAIGVIRRLFPKETDFALRIKEEVKCVEPLFHTRPVSVSITERLMKFWAHVLHFAAECSKWQPERCLPISPPNI
jgi:IS30 family transposase